MSQSSSEESGPDKPKAHKRKSDKTENLLSDPEVAEKEEKLELPCDAFHSPLFHKVSATVRCLMCLVLIILILVVALAVVASRGCKPCCPNGWVGYQQKCYYFSEGEGNWDSSRRRCSALGASLAGIDSLQELTFLMRHKGPEIPWIGLRREGAQPWKWANGTEFNNLFQVKEGANCACLSSAQVSSSSCLTTKKWICSQPSLH